MQRERAGGVHGEGEYTARYVRTGGLFDDRIGSDPHDAPAVWGDVEAARIIVFERESRVGAAITPHATLAIHDILAEGLAPLTARSLPDFERPIWRPARYGTELWEVEFGIE